MARDSHRRRRRRPTVVAATVVRHIDSCGVGPLRVVNSTVATRLLGLRSAGELQPNCQTALSEVGIDKVPGSSCTGRSSGPNSGRCSTVSTRPRSCGTPSARANTPSGSEAIDSHTSTMFEATSTSSITMSTMPTALLSTSNIYVRRLVQHR